MAGNDEPSNPFKNPRKSPSTPNNRANTGRRSQSRKTSGPPAPPGGKRKQSPPVAPSGSKAKAIANDEDVKSPAQAGKSVGLRKQNEKVKTDTETKTDQKARELIEATRTNVVEAAAPKTESRSTATKEPYNPFKKNQPKRTTAPPRRGGRAGKRNKPQGQAKRVKKLHRGKYMEFKYDVRRILDDEDVADEHRSNVLGQTWAKGERQGVVEAKEFLDEKVAEGIISDECSSKIMKLIDSLTTRR